MPVAEAAYQLRLDPEQSVTVGVRSWRPSPPAGMKLRHQRQANPQKAWHDHDLNDVTALVIAVRYCDVVVTEKSWASPSQRRGRR